MYTGTFSYIYSTYFTKNFRCSSSKTNQHMRVRRSEFRKMLRSCWVRAISQTKWNYVCAFVFQLLLQRSSSLGKNPTQAIFCFWKVFIFWSKIYKLPSGQRSDGLFTQRKYSGEKFMAACQSDPLALPISWIREVPQRCWMIVCVCVCVCGDGDGGGGGVVLQYSHHIRCKESQWQLDSDTVTEHSLFISNWLTFELFSLLHT